MRKMRWWFSSKFHTLSSSTNTLKIGLRIENPVGQFKGGKFFETQCSTGSHRYREAYAWFPALRCRYFGAVLPLPSFRYRSSYIRFRCRFVSMRRNWIETTFRSDECQAAQTSTLDEVNMLQKI